MSWRNKECIFPTKNMSDSVALIGKKGMSVEEVVVVEIEWERDGDGETVFSE